MDSFLIDTHSHIYLPEFDEDRESVMASARMAGVQQIYLPAIDSSTHPAMLQTESQFSFCQSMIGLHPCSVKEDYENEIEIVRQFLDQRKFVAVGEIGLDFFWDKSFTEQQYQAFHQQIELALAFDLPIAIHSRNAIDECIATIAQYPALRGVFHCFTGDLQQAEKIISMNFVLGIGGVVTFKNAGLDKVVAQIGLSSVILETDAPYLAPVPNRGKRNEPAYLKLIAEKLAAILGITVEEVARITSGNAEKLFEIRQNR